MVRRFARLVISLGVAAELVLVSALDPATAWAQAGQSAATNGPAIPAVPSAAPADASLQALAGLQDMLPQLPVPRVSAIVGASGDRYAYSYDILGRLTGTEGPEGLEKRLDGSPDGSRYPHFGPPAPVAGQPPRCHE